MKHWHHPAAPDAALPASAQTDPACLPVPPAPELREKMVEELEKLRKRDLPMASQIAFQEQRQVGLDDGLIYPGTLFPLGTTASVAQNAAAERAPLHGTVRVAIVLVNFSDRAISQPASHYDKLFFSLGAVPTGSVREYYREVSNNSIDIQGQIVGPVTLSRPKAYYANGTSGRGAAPNSRTMAQEAAQLANPLINFGSYDNDGDGYIDAFIVIHAGTGAEQSGAASDIWSVKWVLPSPYAADGKTIYAFLTVPEDCRLGVCAHELGHLLFGFPDLYDGVGAGEGIGKWCLMGGGSWNGSPAGTRPAHPSAWCKVKQGWVSVVNQTTNANVSLPDVKSSFKVHRLWKDGSAGSEYFLVENRQKTGFDDHLPNGGLLIWHIDDAVGNNTNEAHYKIALMQADGKRDLELSHNRGDTGDPYPGSTNNHTFNSTSTPNSNSYAGSGTCVAVTNISDPAATMTARFQVRCKTFKEGKEIKDGKEIRKDIFKDKENRKDLIKEKDFHKDVIKDKEIHKDIQPDKPIKEKDKDNFEKPGDKISDGRPGDLGNFGGGFGAGMTTDPTDRLTAIENRLNALEPFISQALRPDLVAGAYSQEADQGGAATELNMDGKRNLDSKAPDNL